MNHSPSRRNFFKTSGAVSASTVLGSTALVGGVQNAIEKRVDFILDKLPKL
jgi:hypothetical protein